MRILFIEDNFPPKNIGGAGKIAFNLAKYLKQLGHDVFVITTTQNKNDEKNVDYQGLKIFKIYADYNERWRAYLCLYNFQTVKKVKKIINKINPDIVHFHNIHYYLSYYCFKIAKQIGAKVFLTAHDAMLVHYVKLTEFIRPNNLFFQKKINYKITAWQKIKRVKKRYNPFRSMIIRHYLKYVDKIFTVSNELKEALKQNKIKNIEVIHNGIDISELRFNDFLVQEFKNKFNLQDKKVILFGGRLSDAKGGKKVILAMQKIAKEIPEAVVIVLGEKNVYVNSMLSFAKKLNIYKKIIFTGWLSGDELKSAYWSSDVIVVPSIYLDPFPTVNLEAMGSKKPVVGTCFGGTPEIVVDGLTGYIINPFNINKFSEKIIFLLKNPIKAKEMGDQGHKIVKNKFSIDEQVRKILVWYN